MTTVEEDELAAPVRAIVALVARIGRRPIAGADASTPFALLGIDSIGSIELAVAVEESFGVQLAPDVLAECRDATALANRVAALRAQTSAATTGDEFDRMFADAVLPDDIVPPRHSRTASLSEARTILLTGATGFLGRWLARELLDRSHATLLCTVRPGPRAEARLHDCLRTVGIDQKISISRVRCIEADLAETSLGLQEAQLDELSHDVDAMFHAGAAVNWVLPYRALRAANVGGTLTLLRFAARRGAAFHFVSSLSVCSTTSGPARADETFDPLPYLRGLHLGYAQTKVVAEALVREAATRGLPVSIHRPSFIAGHSVTGDYNRDDILARFVSGCVRMGTAPDLDWTIDCTPVDATAALVVRLSERLGQFHLGHARPRHWRECALWMRSCGYDVRLVPYHAWLRQLERETADDQSHPLRPLRSFFLTRPEDAGGWTLPELMLSSTRATRRVPGPEPPLDAALLQRYFDAFVDAGDLPRRPRHVSDGNAVTLDARFFSAATGSDVLHAECLERLSEHSIISELTTWRSGRRTGLFRYRLRRASGSEDVVVKVKPSDDDAIAVGGALAALCGERIGRAYERFGERLGLAGSHVRELALYQQTDPRFVRHAPRVLGTMADPDTRTWSILLEPLSGVLMLDGAGETDGWTPQQLEAVVEGLAALQAIWYRRDTELRSMNWIGVVSSTENMCAMAELWLAIAEHAAPAFDAWGGPGTSAVQQQLIETIGCWRRRLEDQPRTLIHNDFNPRNVCLREETGRLRLIAYDWELATPGIPQHDLAEFLCFALRPDASDADVSIWVDRHRLALEHETGAGIDASDWRHGFAASLRDLIVNRLPMYALIHRIRPQQFLPRVVRTWRRLYEHYRHE